MPTELHQVVRTGRPLDRILRFTNLSIDQLINCPIAKRQVLGYYKLHRQVEATIECIDLERQWNPNRP